MAGTKRAELCFRSDIEGLRGIAVLMVVAFHCGIPGFSGGFVGVDVFFVISGYLITGLLFTEIRETGKLDLFAFYARRIRRLLPACALMVMATLATGAAILAPRELIFTSRAARAAAVYASNLFFSTNAANYFAPRVQTNPLLHTWSLAVEEQFYLFWPLLILVGLRRLRSLKALAAVESAVTVVSLAAWLWWSAHNSAFAFYQLPARAWEFGIGGLAVLIPAGRWKPPSRCCDVLVWLGILAILGSAKFIVDERGFPGWTALFPVVGTAAILVAGLDFADGSSAFVLSSAPLQVLGKLSYSWYLWHWPVLVFALALFPKISVSGRIAAATLSLAIAAVTHYFVENPIRFHPCLAVRPAFSISLAAALTVVSLSAATVAVRFAADLANTPEMNAIASAAEDFGSLDRQRCISPGDTAAVKTCTFGNAGPASSIVLFGDSHAIQWFDAFERIAEMHGWTLTTVVKSGCPAADIRLPAREAPFRANCAGWRAAAIGRIVTLRPSLVIVANASIYLRTNNVALAEWRTGTRRTLAALADAGLNVAAMRDTPIAGFDIPSCLARSIRRGDPDSCLIDRAAALDPAIFGAEKSAARGLPNVHFLDLTDQFCQGDICWAVHQGEVLYRDDNHLTGRAAVHLTPALEAQLLPIVSAAYSATPWAYAKRSSYR